MSSADARLPGHTAVLPPLSRWLLWGLTSLLVALVVFAVLVMPAGTSTSARLGAALAGAGILAAFAVGLVSRRWPWLWLGALLVCWVAMVMLSPQAVFIAFPLFFLELHVLGRVGGLLAVIGTWAVSVSMFVTGGTFNLGAVLGPWLGAVVAVVTVWSFEGVQRESERRRVLLEELERTRAELLTSERHAGQLEERERLAAEIHDTLAQGFTGIQLLLGSAERLLDRDPAQAATLVHQARQTAAQNLRDARNLVAAMAPVDLEQSTLTDALGRLANATRARTGVDTELLVQDLRRPLSVEDQAVLLRVAQSAIANVAQHSWAKHATLRLSQDDSDTSLTISDDGIGFDTATAGAEGSGSFGLGLMRRRLQKAGGRLELESDGSGSVVRAILPGR